MSDEAFKRPYVSEAQRKNIFFDVLDKLGLHISIVQELKAEYSEVFEKPKDYGCARCGYAFTARKKPNVCPDCGVSWSPVIYGENYPVEHKNQNPSHADAEAIIKYNELLKGNQYGTR